MVLLVDPRLTGPRARAVLSPVQHCQADDKGHLDLCQVRRAALRAELALPGACSSTGEEGGALRLCACSSSPPLSPASKSKCHIQLQGLGVACADLSASFTARAKGEQVRKKAWLASRSAAVCAPPPSSPSSRFVHASTNGSRQIGPEIRPEQRQAINALWSASRRGGRARRILHRVRSLFMCEYQRSRRSVQA